MNPVLPAPSDPLFASAFLVLCSITKAPPTSIGWSGST